VKRREKRKVKLPTINSYENFVNFFLKQKHIPISIYYFSFFFKSTTIDLIDEWFTSINGLHPKVKLSGKWPARLSLGHQCVKTNSVGWVFEKSDNTH
jgi:hypothetical protein